METFVVDEVQERTVVELLREGLLRIVMLGFEPLRNAHASRM